MFRNPLACFGLCLAVFAVLACPAYADTVAGTLLSLSADSKTITIKDGTQIRKMTLSPNAKIMRGQVGKTQQEVAANELAPGDRVLATIGEDKTVSTIRASYAVIAGNVDRTVGRKIVLKDGKAVFLNSNAQIALATGKIGKLEDITPGAFVICRLEPLSKECWTVIVSKSQSVLPVKPAAAKQSVNNKSTSAAENKEPKKVSGPVINSIAIQAAPNLRNGDVVGVEIRGTPKGIAKAEIRGVAGPVQLKETQPGVYVGAIPLRTTNVIKDAVVTGYLKMGDKAALPAQAAERVSINVPISKPLPPPVNVPKIDLTPPEPAAPPEPPKPVEIASIAITSPDNFAQVVDSIVVRGTGQPGDRILVQIDYTNGLAGLLNISGTITSQLVPVGADGAFVYGPLPLTGRFSTRGLRYTITVSYPDHPDKPVETRMIFGPR